MYRVEDVMFGQADSVAPFLQLGTFERHKNTERPVSCFAVKVKLRQGFAQCAAPREFDGDIFHNAILVAVLKHEVAEQVDNFVGKGFDFGIAKLFGRQVLKHPERHADFLGALLGNIFAGFGLIDDFGVAKLENILDVRFKFAPSLRARRQVIIDELTFAHRRYHRGKRLFSQRPRIVVASVPCKFAVDVMAQQKAQHIAASHIVIVTVRWLLQFLPKDIQFYLRALRKALP